MSRTHPAGLEPATSGLGTTGTVTLEGAVLSVALTLAILSPKELSPTLCARHLLRLPRVPTVKLCVLRVKENLEI